MQIICNRNFIRGTIERSKRAFKIDMEKKMIEGKKHFKMFPKTLRKTTN